MKLFFRYRYMPLGIFLLAGIFFISGCRFLRNDDTSSTQRRQGTGVTCPIDGMPTDAQHLARRPLAVMVENSPKARPQSGLRDACVVYEAITEGGITRFLAVYLHSQPEVIGPVRSARPHFINLAREFDAAYVHCGQSYEALQILATDPTIYNVDQMKYAKPFWRDTSRRAPHNLYTSSTKLEGLLQSFAWDTPVKSLPKFSGAEHTVTGLPASTVDIRFPGASSYKLRLVYNAKLGGYLRYMDGKLHVDRETGKPMVAKNLLIQRVYAEPFTASTHGTFDVDVVGAGGGIFLSHGRQLDMRWTKATFASMTHFRDARGRPLPFRAGQTWVEIVPVDGKVTISAPAG